MFPELIQNDSNDVGFLNHLTKCYKGRSMSSGCITRVLEMLKARLNLVTGTLPLSLSDDSAMAHIPHQFLIICS